MKTLKNLFFVAIALVSTTVFAQDETTLTVNLGDSFEITLTGAPSIDMNTAAHFTDGNSTTMNNHVNVTASNSYVITVEADDTNFGSVEGNTVAVSNVEVHMNNHANSTGSVALNGTTPVDLTTATDGEINADYNVIYAIPAANAGNFLDLGDDTLTATLTYTVVPQ